MSVRKRTISGVSIGSTSSNISAGTPPTASTSTSNGDGILGLAAVPPVIQRPRSATSSASARASFVEGVPIGGGATGLVEQHVSVSVESTTSRFALYFPRYSTWLDDSRPLSTYDVEEQVLELRELSAEFIMRITLPDFDTKIAIRVLPTFKVSDVVAMILNQLANRKLTLHRYGKYALFIAGRELWMDDDAELADYGSLAQEDIQYRIQSEVIQIITPASSTSTSTPNNTTAQPQKFTVDAKCTVEMLMRTVAVSERSPDEEEPHGIYTS
ncbi:hypothetical protein HK102_011080, partial [Quaeritorhiza haematococci]